MSILDKYLLMRPSTRGIIEWFLLFFSGWSSYFTSALILPFRFHLFILGCALFVLGFAIHGMSHRVHKQAHSKAENIERVVTEGIYSKIRHPGYLGLILAYLGASLWFGSVLPIVVAIVLSTFLVLTALKEEESLLRKFGKEYEEYMRRVPWRFIPKVF